MKKYKLVNTITGKTNMCSKIIIDGFDYYITDMNITGKIGYNPETNSIQFFASHPKYDESGKQVIATNKLSFDLPKVKSIIELLLEEYCSHIDDRGERVFYDFHVERIIEEFTKSHSFSEEDMIEFHNFCIKSEFDSNGYTQEIEPKKLLKIWKEQKFKTIYYE